MIKTKNSGVEWIGQIPEDWQICRNKNIMNKKKDVCLSYSGEDVLSLTMKGVVKRDLANPSGKMPATFDGYQKIQKGNLLLCLFDIDVTPRCVGLINDNGLTSPAYSQFVLKKSNYAPYYDYLLRYIDDTKQFLHLSKNLRSSLTEDDFGMIGTVKPPINTQIKIAEILNKKCFQIDEIVKLQEQEIQMLKNYKTSLISELVTKGLDPTVKMKNSKIEWIGQIPEHWQIGRIKNFANLFTGNSIKDEEKEKFSNKINSLPYIATKDIDATNHSIDYENGVYVKEDDLTFKRALKDSILLCIEGGSAGKKIAYLNQNVCFVNKLCCFEANGILSKYLYYYLMSSSFIDEFNLNINGLIGGVSVSKTVNIKTIQPHYDEQVKIANLLDEKCLQIDNLINQKQQKIQKLQDYKKSLIYEYVTGKKRCV